MGNMENNATNVVANERAGFITFWLWLGIIANVIYTPFTIFQLSSMSNLGYLGMQLITEGVDISPFSNAINTPISILIGAAIISAIFYVWGYALLLKWQKKGFLFITITAILNGIVSFICYPMIQDAYFSIGLSADYSLVKFAALLGAGVTIFILWLILQTKKNGVSFWSQLR